MIEGLQTWDDIVTVEEEAALIATMEDLDLAPFRFQQWLGKRLTRSFGWDYDFATGAFGPTDPIPGQFDEVRRRLAVLAGLEPADLAQLLVIRYDASAGIGWHRDRPVFEQIMGISLGAPAKMRFRQRSGARFERHSMMLSPRGVYHMRGSARSNWEHSIAAQEETRWSLTFRSLAGASRKRR